MTTASALPEKTRALLERFGFPEREFERLAAELKAGRFPADKNRDRRPMEPPRPDDLTAWAAPGSATEKEWIALGSEALKKGQIAVAILNGGMATRFGGKVKGIVEVLPGKSFLALRLRDVAKAARATPVFVMNSFATDTATRQHCDQNDWFGLRSRPTLLVQRISVRLTPSGDVFKDVDGQPSLYAPGHGDVFEVLSEAEVFRQFAARGGRAVLIGNVDNLGATLSPKVIGAHLASRKAVTVEVAPKQPGDAGGAPVRVGGRVEIIEGFRFPPSFDPSQVPVFNTNTLIVDAAAVKADYPLHWFRADKKVDDRPAVQFERLMGEVTSFVDSQFLEVPRQGEENRFIPVKTPEDLAAVQPLVRARLGL